MVHESSVEGLDIRPTPVPTGDPSLSTETVRKTFALILPEKSKGIILHSWVVPTSTHLIGSASDLNSDAEGDAPMGRVATSDTCSRPFPEGFITAAAVEYSYNASSIQVR